MWHDEWGKDNEQTVRYFTGLLEKHGVDPRAVDWGSRESQRTRFSVLSQVAPLHRARVLDVGCGLGDLYGWLKEAGIDVQYSGIDITPRMVELARQRFGNSCFQVANLLEAPDPITPQYDYVVASGVFYRRRFEPYHFLHEMVKKMFDLCIRAVSFNSLSSWSSDPADGEFYADPLKSVDLCRDITPWVVLRHDYHPRDFTIYMYKKGQST